MAFWWLQFVIFWVLIAHAWIFVWQLCATTDSATIHQEGLFGQLALLYLYMRRQRGRCYQTCFYPCPIKVSMSQICSHPPTLKSPLFKSSPIQLPPTSPPPHPTPPHLVLPLHDMLCVPCCKCQCSCNHCESDCLHQSSDQLHSPHTMDTIQAVNGQWVQRPTKVNSFTATPTGGTSQNCVDSFISTPTSYICYW